MPGASRVGGTAVPPRPAPSPIPLIGNLNRIDLNRVFSSANALHKEHRSRTLRIGFLTKEAYYFRHPDDLNAILVKNASNYPKSSNTNDLDEWLGTGLFTQRDASAHGAMRDTLSPPFRPDYVRQLSPMFASAAYRAANKLAAAAAARAPVDVQDLCKRLALDVLGLTGFAYAFNALNGAGEASGELSRSELDILATLRDIEQAAIFLLLELKTVPRWLLPGYAKYKAGIGRLDAVVDAIVAQRRAAGIALDAKDLLAYLMRAQASPGAATTITDKAIRDELMTMLFAGSDTSANTLAQLFRQLALHPDVASAVRSEIRSVLAGRPPADVTPEDVKAMRLLNACINETLRLVPAAPELVRLSKEDDRLGPFDVPAGTLCVLNIYSMHHHEDFFARCDEFLPERWLDPSSPLAPTNPHAFLPLGSGPRACIGRHYALLQLGVAAAVILSAVGFKPAAGKPDVDLVSGLTLKSATGIWLTPVVAS